MRRNSDDTRADSTPLDIDTQAVDALTIEVLSGNGACEGWKDAIKRTSESLGCSINTLQLA